MTLNQYSVDTIQRIRRLMLGENGQGGHRFLMLKGPTGTGKTLYAQAVACLIAGDTEGEDKVFGKPKPYYDSEQESESYDRVYHDIPLKKRFQKLSGEKKIWNVVFHKSTSYENFVHGVQIHTQDGKMEYKKDGRIFLNALDQARDDADSGQKYVIILDDIGRADFSRVMGDILSALEPNNDDNAVRAEKEPHTVPENLYIIATYDPTVSGSTVDYAWFRRFLVYEMVSDPGCIIGSREIIHRNNAIFPLRRIPKDQWTSFSNFYTMDPYQKLMDYVYVLFMHMKIMFDRYFVDKALKNAYIPGHGLFLTYEKSNDEDKDFADNIEKFRLQLKHRIVPLLYQYVKEGLLDPEAEFDIQMMEHLWDTEGEDLPSTKSKLSPGPLKDQPTNAKIQYAIIHDLFEEERFPVPILYFFFIRNPLLMRTDFKSLTQYFLFDIKPFVHIQGENRFHQKGDNTIVIIGKRKYSAPYKTARDFSENILMDEHENYIDIPNGGTKESQIYAVPVFFTLLKAYVKLTEIKKCLEKDDKDLLSSDSGSQEIQNDPLYQLVEEYENKFEHYKNMKEEKKKKKENTNGVDNEKTQALMRATRDTYSILAGITPPEADKTQAAASAPCLDGSDTSIRPDT